MNAMDTEIGLRESAKRNKRSQNSRIITVRLLYRYDLVYMCVCVCVCAYLMNESGIIVTIRYDMPRWFSNFHHNSRSLGNLVTQDRMCEPYYRDNARDGKWHVRGPRRDCSSSSSASL